MTHDSVTGTKLQHNPFDDFLRLYQFDWVGMVREVLGADPDPFQESVLRAACGGDIRRISIRSGHGVGKTTTLAWCIVCHNTTRFPQKTLCTAPTSTQLFDALAAETKAWFKKLPALLRELFEIKTDVIELVAAPDESFTTFATSRAETPEALAGKHSEHMLIVADEASGIPEQVFEAAIGSMSGHNAVTILAGNPVRTSGLFFDSHNRLKDQWFTVHISCVGHPRISEDFIEEAARRYGRESNAFRVRVLGEFPIAQDDTIIPYGLAHAALERDIAVTPGAVPVWGLDCARGGGDKSALAKRCGNVLLEPTKVADYHDTMQVVGWVVAEWERTPIERRPVEILVDVIGIGAGVVDRLREIGLPARGVNVSEAPAIKGQFQNLRSSLWWDGLEWFETRKVNIANDIDLLEELVRPLKKFSSVGKMRAETKDELKKRGYASPNRADAFLLTFAGTAALAAGQGVSWGTVAFAKGPLRRKIGGLV